MKTNLRLATIAVVTLVSLFLVTEAIAQDISSYCSSDVPKVIQDNGTIYSSLTVMDTLAIGDVDVVINIRHSYCADLDVYLIAPDGTEVELFTDVGGSGNNFTNTILDDEGYCPIGGEVGNPSAPFSWWPYQPEGKLSDFDGRDAKGEWQLKVTDDDGVFAGVLQAWCLFIEGVSIPSVSVSIAAETDDAEEDVGGSAEFKVDLTSSDLEFMYDNDTSNPLDEQVVGIRFVNIEIAKGTTIGKATVRFQADDVDDPEHVGDAYVIIEGELSPNPVTFEDTLNNITARPRTKALVPWGPAHWDTKGAQYWTPDISSVIQEIVDQDGWASGNALVLIFSQDPAIPSTGVLEAEAGPGDDAALLHIEF